MRQFNCIVQKVDILLKINDIIDTFGGIKVIHVSGHTPESTALYQQELKINNSLVKFLNMDKIC